MKITIDCRPEHLHALRQACETYFRIALGQFRDVAEPHAERAASESASASDIADMVERACKQILTPDMPHFGSSYGVGSPHVSAQAHACYELWKLLGGGTPGAPLNYSGLPLPKVVIEKELA